VDDHEIVREDIRTLIDRSRSEWEICGEATNGEEAIEVTKTLKPDIIVLDITMPRMSGSSATNCQTGSRVPHLDVHDARLR